MHIYILFYFKLWNTSCLINFLKKITLVRIIFKWYFSSQINDILVCPLFEYFSSLVSFIKKISYSRGRFIFSIHIFGSFTSASKTIPLFMHFKDSTLSARATIAQVFTTLQFMSNPNLHVIWSKNVYIL